MPGMKLNFLKSAPQRVAGARPMPLKQVEAILMYGRPEQRAKVVEKLLPTAYGLAINHQTHHVLMTLLDRCDHLDRVKLLYRIRQKILDLSMSPVGNKVLQKLLDVVPSRQRREIAEMFVLNVQDGELKRVCEHGFGNHVAQKMMLFRECVEVLQPTLQRCLPDLATHEYGMRVVESFIRDVEDGWKVVVEEVLGLHPDDLLGGDEGDISVEVSTQVDVAVARLFDKNPESMVICALFRHPFVPQPLKDAICARLCEYATPYIVPTTTTETKDNEEEANSVPEFMGAPKLSSATDPSAPRHVHTFCAVFEHGAEEHREELWRSLEPVSEIIQKILTDKRVVSIAVAAVRYHPGCRCALFSQLMKQGKNNLPSLAEDPVASLVLRTFIEVDFSRLTEQHISALISSKSVELAKSPVGSPVLQKLVEADPSGATTAKLFMALREDLSELVLHHAASFIVQYILSTASADDRSSFTRSVLAALGDLKNALGYTQGSRVLQKVLAYTDDETITSVIQELVNKAAEAPESDAEKDEESDIEKEELTLKEQRERNRKKHYRIQSNAILSYATHGQACFVIQGLLLETRSRQLLKERRMLMNELKPHVFELAVSPWAGRVVLDAMLTVGSLELQAAIKDVVFLKAEAWLAEGGKKRVTTDPTTRSILKRQREQQDDDARVTIVENSGAKKKVKKLHRSLKR